MKKKLFVIIAVIAIIYAAIFATVALITIFLPATVYDNQKLLAGGDSSNRMNYRLSIHDETTTVKCDKMTGSDTLWKYNADNDKNLQMEYTFQVTSGKAKLILVNPDDTIITLAEQAGADGSELSAPAESIVELDLKKGVNRIKIVCEKGATFSLSFKFS